MHIGTHFAGDKFIDVLGNCEYIIEIDSEGFVDFKVKQRSTSVWVLI